MSDRSERRWEAVATRTPGREPFVYAVRTTGVFCLPGCASRRPNRANVEFFDTAEGARRAGYRACQRCRPEGGEDPVAAAIVDACALLGGETGRTVDVARAVGMSPAHFQRTFKERLGVTPQQYRRRILAERGRDALGTSPSVTDSVFEAGYSSASRFYEGIGRELGMSPKAARSGGAGERIAYAVARCSLGEVLVAWTERGVCQVAFGAGAVDDLRERFPEATLTPGDGEWVARVIAAVEHADDGAIPLDIRGTAFQERVWQVLRTIPRGETWSYARVAEALGRPTASRAVARACATNTIAVLIPCHRVVRSDGGLSGYRWGIERKRALLDREGG